MLILNNSRVLLVQRRVIDLRAGLIKLLVSVHLTVKAERAILKLGETQGSEVSIYGPSVVCMAAIETGTHCEVISVQLDSNFWVMRAEHVLEDSCVSIGGQSLVGVLLCMKLESDSV